MTANPCFVRCCQLAMSSSEDDEGKPLLDGVVEGHHHEDDDPRPATVHGRAHRSRSGLARMAMQSYEQVEDFVEMTDLCEREEPSRGRRRRSAAASNTTTSSQPNVTNQPIQNSFDDASKTLHSTLSLRHPVTSGQLNNVISSTGNALQTDCCCQARHIAPGLNYSDLLRYFLVDGETLITPQGKQLFYGRIIMLNEKGEQYRKLPKGQAFLTNKRLIFLSCEHMQKASLRPRRGPTTFYELIAKEGDATVYVPIPLACVKGVELISYSVTASMAEIDATAGCCGGAFACFRSCFTRAVTRWSSGPTLREHATKRVLRVGLLMPPWGERTTAEICLHPALSVPLASEFLGALQKYALPG